MTDQPTVESPPTPETARLAALDEIFAIVPAPVPPVNPAPSRWTECDPAPVDLSRLY